MDLGLAHKIVFITGGSRGIGQVAAIRFAREGARVAFSYRTDRARADDTVAAVQAEGGEALPVWLDLADPDSIAQAVTAVQERWGGIDAFVANAVQWPSSVPDFQRRFEDMPREEWRLLLEANLGGTIASVQAVLPAMRDRGDGRIVLVSSDVARHGFQGSGGYGSVKAALSGLTSALIAELGGDILVNIVTPGFTSPSATWRSCRSTCATGRLPVHPPAACPHPTMSPARSCSSAHLRAATLPATRSTSPAETSRVVSDGVDACGARWVCRAPCPLAARGAVAQPVLPELNDS